MGSQVSTNLKQALLHHQPSKKPGTKSPKSHADDIEAKNRRIGILSFEVANVMSKTIYLHKSLTDSEISKLRSEISSSEGVQSLVSTDQDYLLELVMAEKLDDLNRVAAVVARLGKKCSEPALQGFEHVYGDILNGVIEVTELGFLVKDMDAMVKKLERYVNATSNLYGEMEVLNELEQATKKFQNNQHEESKRAFEQKLSWQRQDVRHLREISLWNQTYDKVVELLARTVCTVYARIRAVFANPDPPPGPMAKEESLPLKRSLSEKRRLFRPEDLVFPCGTVPGRVFMECLSLSTSVADDHDDDRSSQVTIISGPRNKKALKASTVGGSALALHYANVIIVIEKLLRYPHLVGEEARDELYRMLPESVRAAVRAGLRSSAESLAIYDGPVAHDWRERLGSLLGWLGPMAHDTMRWHSERNYEQSRREKRSNVLLLQTLHFADRAKTEASICQLLLGLNYICRYERQQNALLDCAASFDFEDCVEWQLQCRAASYVD